MRRIEAMKKMLVVSPSKCIDCKKCQLACSYRHHDVFDPDRARIRVLGRGVEQGTPVVCLQCEEAACRAVCPTGALMVHDDNGAISIDRARCIGCMACVAACPFGNMTVDGVEGTVQKCDLCSGNPMCVVFCPTGALAYEELDEERAGTGWAAAGGD